MSKEIKFKDHLEFQAYVRKKYLRSTHNGEYLVTTANLVADRNIVKYYMFRCNQSTSSKVKGLMLYLRKERNKLFPDFNCPKPHSKRNGWWRGRTLGDVLYGKHSC